MNGKIKKILLSFIIVALIYLMIASVTIELFYGRALDRNPRGFFNLFNEYASTLASIIWLFIGLLLILFFLYWIYRKVEGFSLKRKYGKIDNPQVNNPPNARLNRGLQCGYCGKEVGSIHNTPLGTPFKLRIWICHGCGAYVCNFCIYKESPFDFFGRKAICKFCGNEIDLKDDLRGGGRVES